jgi:HprK-related kinase A
LIVAELAAGELRRRLTGPGLRLRFGPVVAEIRSPFDSVAKALELHYAEHDVLAESDFTDFRVAVEPPFGVRRFVAQQAFFKFDGNARFRPLPAAQAFPLLEWGLNWCVTTYCHQYLIIHSAVLEREGRALLLPAPPGSGKSTLCAGLVASGWRLLSDELALVELDGRRVVPIPRPISLKNRSIDTIARFWPEAAIAQGLGRTRAPARRKRAPRRRAARARVGRVAPLCRGRIDSARKASEVRSVHAARRQRVQLQRARAWRIRCARIARRGERLLRVHLRRRAR